ncbi:MAG: L,D-transpeptidase family protein [Deltaproteobacteria bacterium]|nr:L,D-transpeptidase family protein [Deltaproteobacteria bacterium]
MSGTDNDGHGKPPPPKNRRVNSKSGLDGADAPLRDPRSGSVGNVRRGDGQGSAEPTASSGGTSATALVGGLVGIAVGAGAIAAVSWAGRLTDRPPTAARPSAASTASVTEPTPPPVAASVEVPQAPPDDANEPEVAEPDAPAPPPEEKPWAGPWLGAMAQMTPVYPTARFSKNRLGYLRRGAKVATLEKPVFTESCKQGFYQLVDGGYVCGKYATLNVDDPRVKLGVKSPDLEASMPYRYAYNTAHGTPLYTQVPSREDMVKYEPYLKDRDKKKKAKEDGDKPDKAEKGEKSERDDKERVDKTKAEKPDRLIEKADQPRSELPEPSDGPADAKATPSGTAVAVEAPPSAASAVEPEEEKPWWQRDTKEKPLDIKLSDLEESDGTLAKRMVKGFFVAIDRGFSWNNRLWWKTTEGLIAPSDRMIGPKIPDLRGFDMSSGVKQVGFVRASAGSKYERRKEGKGFSKKGKVGRFASFALTTNTELENKQRFYETTDGFWLREADIAITEPGPKPERIGANEKWVDVNLTRKTLVAMLGDKPIYAALVSPGKSSSNREKDHRTKTGMFRIREKHIATTMDGDGTSGGDLPYSIMDVPYVEYYEGSYALHAAFWHNNFGREQSHGCVNLAPADAKWLFFWTEPALPKGWHGVWSSDKRQGSWVVIHE